MIEKSSMDTRKVIGSQYTRTSSFLVRLNDRKGRKDRFNTIHVLQLNKVKGSSLNLR